MTQLTLTLKMTTAQVVETSVTVNNNSPIQHYVHPDDQTQPFEMTPGFKPFTQKCKLAYIWWRVGQTFNITRTRKNITTDIPFTKLKVTLNNFSRATRHPRWENPTCSKNHDKWGINTDVGIQQWFKSCQMLETEKETQMEYEINFYFKKGIRLLSFQAEDWLHLRRS